MVEEQPPHQAQHQAGDEGRVHPREMLQTWLGPEEPGPCFPFHS